MESESEPEQGNKSCRPSVAVVAVQFETSLMDLNDYCLLKVFAHLNLLDMLNIRLTCKRLQVVSEMAAHKFNYFNLNAFAKYPLCDHFHRVMEYIAPAVETIESFVNSVIAPNYDICYTYDDLLNEMGKYNFPKLTSLRVREACHLSLFTNENIEILDVRHVRRGELNNCDITKVKMLTFGKIEHCVPISELLQFFNRNPNIERLILMTPMEHKLPSDFFTNLKNLRMLDYPLGKHPRDLECALQIENLTELALNGIWHMDDLPNTVENFLTVMVPKQTLKSIKLRSIYFDSLANILAKLNLVSLHYEFRSSCCHRFLAGLRTVSVPTLKYFHVVGPVDVRTIFVLMKHLTALEYIQFSLLKPYKRQKLLKKLTQLLATSRTRPNLEIDFFEYLTPITVKICFELGSFKIKEKIRMFSPENSSEFKYNDG